MNRSYLIGIQVVSWTILASAALAPLLFGLGPPAERAGHDLGTAALPLGTYRLTERSGRAVTERDLADRVWIAAFIFTRCPSSCPRISSTMKSVQARLSDTGVWLVSISVDPAHDTPKVLSDYASRIGADPDRWWFLTGPRADVYRLILDQFKVPVAESSPEDRRAGAEAVSHSARLALVDRGNRVVGYFDSNDAAAIQELLKRARQLDGGWATRLPAVNAFLNATSGILLLAGWSMIRARRVRGHATCMIASLVVSGLFLVSYLVYHSQAGSVRFRGIGAVRYAYLTVLMSHTVLAAAVVPLIILTVARVVQRRYADHARMARLTFPVWMYVSITGVLVYWMLYHLDVPAYPI